VPSKHVSQAVVITIATLLLGVVATIPTTGSLTVAGQYAVATMVFAAVLWVTGALPLPLTALLIPIVLTVFGVYPDFGDAVAGFADPVIFLLLVGFMFAEALQKHAIDQRIALSLLVRFGTSARGLVLGVMVATALLSMVISNTATVAMMVPIALGIIESVTHLTKAGEERPASTASNLQIGMLLGIAYAASLGGVGTLIGTPPNAIVVGQLNELLGFEITFVEWLAIGLPMVVVTLPVAWVLLTYVVYPPQEYDVSRAREHASDRLHSMGSLSTRGRRTLGIFGGTAFLWLLGGLEFLFDDILPRDWYVTLFGGMGRNVFGTLGHEGVLFYVLVGLLAIPVLVVTGATAWDDMIDIDWGTLLLLGGGISLANALADTNATVWLAEVTLGSLTGTSILVILLVVVTMTIVVGELASNTAMAAILAPLLINIGPAYAEVLGTSGELAAVLLAVTGAIAASYGFALPVATPPNAIVFGAGYIEREHMLRAGALLDAIVILLTTGVAYLLIRFFWPLVLG
jgi:sodium-dependent dicarboxylate transporter 2/3/5